MTPFGALVEPEVYCRKASASGVGDVSNHGSTAEASGLSVASQRRSRKSGASVKDRRSDLLTVSVHKTIRAPESSTMPRNRSSDRLRCGG